MRVLVPMLMFCLGALVLIGAAPADNADLLRQANAAFAHGDFAEALTLYEQAEERAADPGLIAFNKGATLYRLGRWREAQLCYRRCLEDQELPPARRARALYDLGNSLLRDGAESESAKTLALAIEFYRLCLGDAAGQGLHGPSRHNLELARLLWLKAVANKQKNPDATDPKEPPKQERKDQRADGKEGGDDQPEPKGKPSGEKKTGMEQATRDRQKAIELDQKLAGKGNLKVLLDTDQLLPLDGHDTAALLDLVARRIQREQQERRERDAARRGTLPNVKDW